MRSKQLQKNEKIESAKNLEIQLTSDGSHTIFVPELNEHYHSVHGAINESRHIFIEAGLNFISQKTDKINILEIGFGTGLNALLTYLEAEKKSLFINYSSIELYPLNEDVFSKLNYAEQIQYQDIHNIFLKLHQSPWDQDVFFSDYFSLRKMKISLRDYIPVNQYFDLIYFDAFGPDVQPEMWTADVFKKMAFCLKNGGVLVTYSTKGTVKRNLKDAGFIIEKLPGPVGKREILRAEIAAGIL
jgi:tRNA U34 5-methylaminomethyl-2-thiouridine-forming methyltransferase MnmC